MTRDAVRSLTLGSAALVLLGTAGVPAVARAADSQTRVPVTAFFQSGESTGLITASAAATTTVGVDGVSVTHSGNGVAVPDGAARHALAVSHQDGLRAEFLVSNWDNSIEDFSPAIADRLLSSPANISTVASKLAHDVAAQGWDGVSIDLEALHAKAATGLVSFLKELRQKLPAGKTISICISNSTSPTEYRQRGYWLAAIGTVVDGVIDMAYDQHGPWENQPGPVGALAWQKQGVAAMEKSVPAVKIDLGQAGYGYIWAPTGTTTVSDAKARTLVADDGATAHFDNTTGEWLAHLSDGSTMWWADARSFQIRLALVRATGLHGLAVWDLGDSDQLVQ